MNIIITGPKHCGKSTVIGKLIPMLKGSVSGFISEFDDRASSSRKLLIRSIDGSNSQTAVSWHDGAVNINSDCFDEFTPFLISDSCDFIVIDELGKFEKNSAALKDAVTAAFDSEAHVIASIRLDAAGWMQELKKREDVIVMNVDNDNRDGLPDKILSMLSAV